MRTGTREILKSRVKEGLYAALPLSVTGGILRLAMPGGSPMLPEIVAREAIFIHVPKAAGTSVKTELYGRPLGGRRRIAEFMAYAPERTRAFAKLCFVRNPWDRLLSAHAYLTQGKGASGRDRRFAAQILAPKGDFEGFVTAIGADRAFRHAVMSYDHFRPQWWWTCLPGAETHAMDFVGRFETFEADMARLRATLGLPEKAASERSRASGHAPYREAYDTRMRDIVAGLYARDAALFDYTF
ncbi:MAG: hypothetical protein CML46_16855 [Rhodobacteraceae bacterium]|nr:hypothetical protein [Paracoccaceae bacterium]MBR28586.1 hypothetical protein [Paracoccaceae bacterium]